MSRDVLSAASQGEFEHRSLGCGEMAVEGTFGRLYRRRRKRGESLGCGGRRFQEISCGHELTDETDPVGLLCRKTIPRQQVGASRGQSAEERPQDRGSVTRGQTDRRPRGSPNEAPSAMITMSHSKASVHPAPMAGPLTAATIGTWRSRNAPKSERL